MCNKLLMEPNLVSPQLIMITLSFLLIFLLMVRKKGGKIDGRSKEAAPKLPPGPWRLPIIGNIHNLVGLLPHKVLRDLSLKYGSLMHLRLGQLSVVVVSSPEVAREVMKTHDLNFSQRPDMIGPRIITYGYADLVFAPYGDYWRQLRKICILELLSAKRVNSFHKVREEEIAHLIQSISSAAGTPINLSKKIYSLGIDITARATFGDKCEDGESFNMAMDEITRLLGGFSVADLFPSSRFLVFLSGAKQRFEKIHQKFDRIVNHIIQAHIEKIQKHKEGGKQEEEEDLADVLLRLREHGDFEFDLTLNNIKGVIFDLFAAGSETTSTTMDWAMSHMMKNPRVMEKAQAEVREVLKGKQRISESDIGEMNYLKLVIKETLRLSPPLPLLLPREAMKKCEIDGYEIPMKARILVNSWAIGRDPKHWERPEDFEPERFLDSSIDFQGKNFELIPFGSGRRGCPGMLFSLATIELALANLLYHFDWKLSDGMRKDDLDMSETFGITLARKVSLKVVPIPHIP